MKNRSRPCLACCKTSPKHRHPAAAAVATSGYKAAMKAGIPNMKNRAELEAIIQRRQNYRAPKPSALSSHARHIRGTLAPPLSAGCGIEPLVDYPDYKRLDSTYRMSYGAHHLFQQRRRRPKTLTAILNEKNCRQWRSWITWHVIRIENHIIRRPLFSIPSIKLNRFDSTNSKWLTVHRVIHQVVETRRMKAFKIAIRPDVVHFDFVSQSVVQPIAIGSRFFIFDSAISFFNRWFLFRIFEEKKSNNFIFKLIFITITSTR